jgi:hypothetical protein
MDRTIPTPHHSEPKPMEQIPRNSHPSPQQLKERLNQICPKQTAHRLGTAAYPSSSHLVKQPTRQAKCRTIATTPNPRHQRPQYTCEQQSPDRSALQTRPTGLAQSQEPDPAIRNNKTCTQTPWTLQNNKNHFPCGVQTRTSPSMDNSPRVSHIITNPICGNNRTRPQLFATATRPRQRRRTIRSRDHPEPQTSQTHKTITIPPQVEGIPRKRQHVGASSASTFPRPD